MNYKLINTLERMKNLIATHEEMKSTILIPKPDRNDDENEFYIKLNEAYETFYKAFNALITDEAKRIIELQQENES